MKVGDKYSSLEEFEEALRLYKNSVFNEYWIRDSRTIKNQRRRFPETVDKVNESLKYYYMRLSCIKGGRPFKSKNDQSSRKCTTLRQDCEATIFLRVSASQKTLDVIELNEEHNHESSEAYFNSLAQQRLKLPESIKHHAKDGLKAGANKKNILDQIQQLTGCKITLKDLTNLTRKKKYKEDFERDEKDEIDEQMFGEQVTKGQEKQVSNMRITEETDIEEIVSDAQMIENKRKIQKIKSEPLFECQSSMDADNDSDDDYIEPDNKSNSDVNTTMDPLSTVLNSDLGISTISQLENKEVVRLKIELLKYKLETEKLKRKRIEDLIQADAAERETKARESSLKLRAARLEAIAAEMKLPPAHPALAYTAEETRAQHYIHQYHAT